MFYVKQATLSDFNQIMTIIAEAKQLLKAAGSPQWQDGHPNQQQIKQDLKNHQCWILMDSDGTVAGTATLLTTPEPSYKKIEGAWHSDEPYATIHRLAIASKYRGHHLAPLYMEHLITIGNFLGFNNFRIDTHELNIGMQKVIKKSGFQPAGIIYVNPTIDGKRLAYELNL